MYARAPPASDSSDTPGTRGTGEPATEAWARGDDGPSECAARSGVAHALALRADAGLPETERRVGVAARAIAGNWCGSRGEGAPLLRCEGARADESDEESEPESERASGLAAKPASSGSGRARGEIWIFAIDAEGANCARAGKP